MRTNSRITLSALAVGLTLGMSGAGAFESVETRHSYFDLARDASSQPSMTVGQAGPAGPVMEQDGFMQWDDPTLGSIETQFSAYDLARTLGEHPAAGQAGPTGPVMEQTDWMERDIGLATVETRHNAYDLGRQHDAGIAR